MNEREMLDALEMIHREAAAARPGAGLKARLLAIPASATSARSAGMERFRSPQNSVPLAAAAAVATLFVALLVFAWLTRPPANDAVSVGATPSVTASPAPATLEPSVPPADDLLPGVALEIEEVEPGVFHVISDGIRQLAVPLPAYSYGEHAMRITAGLDGSVWIQPQARTYKGRPQEMHPGHELPFRIGAPADPRMGESGDAGDGIDGFPLDAPLGPDGMAVAADGTPYVLADGIWEFAPEPDGDAYRRWVDAGGLTAFDPAGGLWAYSQAFDRGVLARTDDGWEWDPAIDVPTGSGPMAGYMWVSQDGTVWLGSEGHLSRFDGASWTRVDGPVGSMRPMDVGLDGTAWAIVERESALLRLDDTMWTRFDEEDGVPPMGGHELPVALEVAPDGSVWVNSVPLLDEDEDLATTIDECGGVHHFDGVSWSRYLPGLCVYDLDIAPDGTAWLRAGQMDLGVDRAETAGPVEVHAVRPGAGDEE